MHRLKSFVELLDFFSNLELDIDYWFKYFICESYDYGKLEHFQNLQELNGKLPQFAGDPIVICDPNRVFDPI